jgi:hypothetical protein
MNRRKLKSAFLNGLLKDLVHITIYDDDAVSPKKSVIGIRTTS